LLDHSSLSLHPAAAINLLLSSSPLLLSSLAAFQMMGNGDGKTEGKMWTWALNEEEGKPSGVQTSSDRSVSGVHLAATQYDRAVAGGCKCTT
jgi:hypothetical protein